IVTSRSVDLEPLHHKYLTDLLVGYGWGGLMDLPEVVYPNLVRMFYKNVELKGRGAQTELADNIGDDMLNTIIETICVDRDTLGSILHHLNAISYNALRLRELHRGNPRVDDEVAPPAQVAPVAPAPTPVPAQCTQFQQTVTASLQTLRRRYTELRTDSLQHTEHLERLEATQTPHTNVLRSFEVEQIRLTQVHGQVRYDIAHSEERLRADIDELTQLIRFRFPFPSDDP
ncbi:hypothetical protein Dimus_011004, partial [Dionaea muscipula]